MRRHGGEKRGNSEDRRRRKLWLLKEYGNGQTCRCVFCSETLTYKTLTVDRIEAGGPYTHDNVQPACFCCNRRRGRQPIEAMLAA